MATARKTETETKAKPQEATTLLREYLKQPLNTLR